MTIFKDELSDYLTEAPIDRFARASHPGMAHFAGTGPYRKTCRECSFWAHSAYDYTSKAGKFRGLIKPARCKKYQQLTQIEGSKVPDDTPACKYFEGTHDVPARYAK